MSQIMEDDLTPAVKTAAEVFMAIDDERIAYEFFEGLYRLMFYMSSLELEQFNLTFSEVLNPASFNPVAKFVNIVESELGYDGFLDSTRITELPQT